MVRASLQCSQVDTLSFIARAIRDHDKRHKTQARFLNTNTYIPDTYMHYHRTACTRVCRPICAVARQAQRISAMSKDEIFKWVKHQLKGHTATQWRAFCADHPPPHMDRCAHGAQVWHVAGTMDGMMCKWLD